MRLWNSTPMIGIAPHRVHAVPRDSEAARRRPGSTQGTGHHPGRARIVAAVRGEAAALHGGRTERARSDAHYRREPGDRRSERGARGRTRIRRGDQLSAGLRRRRVGRRAGTDPRRPCGGDSGRRRGRGRRGANVRHRRRRARNPRGAGQQRRYARPPDAARRDDRRAGRTYAEGQHPGRIPVLPRRGAPHVHALRRHRRADRERLVRGGPGRAGRANTSTTRPPRARWTR